MILTRLLKETVTRCRTVWFTYLLLQKFIWPASYSLFFATVATACWDETWYFWTALLNAKHRKMHIISYIETVSGESLSSYHPSKLKRIGSDKHYLLCWNLQLEGKLQFLILFWYLFSCASTKTYIETLKERTERQSEVVDHNKIPHLFNSVTNRFCSVCIVVVKKVW